MSIFEKINLYVMLTMQDDYIEDEEVLAYTCQLHVNQNMHNIHAAFNKFEAYVANKHPKLSISNIYNRYVYNWFHGNILTFIYNLIFAPHAYLPKDFRANRKFIQDCITLIYKLTTYPVYNVRDDTLFEYLKDLKDAYNCFPLDYDQFIVLRTIAKHGHMTIILRDLLAIKLARMRKKKKDAVRVIEDWWFKIINDPSTVQGARMLTKRAKNFNAKYTLEA